MIKKAFMDVPDQKIPVGDNSQYGVTGADALIVG